MTRLSDGEVRQSDVMRWAQDQALFLRPSSLHHVLLYLCLNAFYKSDNPEGRSPGNVLTGRSRLRTISRYTGMSQSTARRALQGLQDNGYIWAKMSGGGWEQNVIFVAWSEEMDDMRAEFRAGLRELPKVFRRKIAPAPAPRPDAKVLDFRRRPVAE